MQFVHLSCINSTISKQSKLSFHLSPFTQEYHRVHPKWFLSLWCIRRKLCTYLAPKLTLSPNRPNRAFTWASSPTSTIGNFHNDFWAYGALGNYLAPKLILSPAGPKRDSIWYTSSSSSIGCIYSSIGRVQIDLWAYGMFHANRAPILHQDLALYPNRASTWAPLPRNNITCVQNSFLAYGALGTNRVPILHRN